MSHALVGLLVLALACSSAALAAWSVSGAGVGYTKARSMPQGATPTNVIASWPNVAVSWSAVTIGEAAVDSYTIRRYAEAGGVQATLANCSGAIAALTCTEIGVPAGRWQYTNQPVKASWLGGESARSSTVVIVAAPVTISCTSCSTFGTTRYVNDAGKAAASVRVALAASSVASDTVHLTLTDSASTTITATQAAPAGSGTVDFSGINTSTLVDGALTVTAWVTADTSDSSPTTTTSLVRDVVAPSASDIFGTNGGTARTIDAADTLVYRFSEAMSPASILGGWTGSSTATSASIVAGDTITVTSSSLGSVSTGGAGYILLTRASCPASIAMSGSTVTLTLNSCTVVLPGTRNPLAGNSTFAWTPSASATDQAGNPMATTSASESGGPKANF